MVGRSVWLVLTLCLLPLLPGCGDDARVTSTAQHIPLQQPGLPVLESLPKPMRQLSEAATYGLLLDAPLLTSPSNTTVLEDGIELDARGESFAWAVYGLDGFDGDSLVPTGIYIEASDSLWAAVSNYSTGRWQLFQSDGTGLISLSNGDELVSPAGTCYVAAIAYDQLVTVSTFNLTTSDPLGSVLLSEVEHNDSLVEANPLPAGAPGFRGHVGPDGYDGDTSDYFVFPASAGQVVEATLNYDALGGNLSLNLLDADGISYYSDSQGNDGSRNFKWGLREGPTYLRVSRQTGAGSYTLEIEFSFPGYGETEENDSISSANPLLALPVLNLRGSLGNFGYDGDNSDYFVLQAGDTELLDTTITYDVAEANFKLRLLDAQGITIYEEDEGNPGQRSFTWGLKDGPHYLNVRQVSGYGDYELSSALLSTGYEETEDNDGIGEADVLVLPLQDFNGHVGDFGYDGDAFDYLALNPADGELMEISLNYTSSDGNLEINVLDDNGLVLHSEGDGNPGLREFDWGFQDAAYYLRIRAADGYSSYSLDIQNSLPGYDETEDNDSSQTPDPLGDLPVMDFFGHVGAFGYDGDSNDYMSFVLSDSELLSASLSYATDGGAANLYLYLLDSDGFIIESDTDGNPGSRSVSAPLSAGNYVIRVRANSGSSDYFLDAQIVP